jgi:hypothetical protein
LFIARSSVVFTAQSERAVIVDLRQLRRKQFFLTVGVDARAERRGIHGTR